MFSFFKKKKEFLPISEDAKPEDFGLAEIIPNPKNPYIISPHLINGNKNSPKLRITTYQMVEKINGENPIGIYINEDCPN